MNISIISVILTLIQLTNNKIITKKTYRLILNQTLWEPVPIEINHFLGRTVKDVAQTKLGLINLAEIKTNKYSYSIDDKLLKIKKFDLRDNNSCIDYIDSQLNCNASPAFAVANVLSDRLCIKSDLSKETNRMSSQSILYYFILDLISCDMLSYGCRGMSSISAFYTLIKKGVPHSSCQSLRIRRNNYQNNFNCLEMCDNEKNSPKYIKLYSENITKLESLLEIKHSLLNFGPLYAEMEILDDFFHYNRGVYKNVTSNVVGYHSIRVSYYLFVDCRLGF